MILRGRDSIPGTEDPHYGVMFLDEYGTHMARFAGDTAWRAVTDFASIADNFFVISAYYQNDRVVAPWMPVPRQ